MAIDLVALRFNWDLESASRDAMTIRRNRATPVVLPEWEATRCVRPEDSPAAYPMKQTYGNKLSLRGKFRLVSGTCKEGEVTGSGPAPGVFSNVLGQVPPTPVPFGPSGESPWIELPLVKTAIWKAGVGVYDIAWDWMFRCDGEKDWRPMRRTLHRIYVTLGLPPEPWRQTGDLDDHRLPWTEALDYACEWAKAAQQFDDASEAVTRAIYALGPARFVYDCPGGGGTHYAYPVFNLTAFLDRLRGGSGNGVYVNCTDCATFVSTLANLLGCDWWQSQMGYGFELNPVLAIGSSVWEPACHFPGGFSYHEVAWADGCTENDVICDACLQVNGSPDPTGPPFVGLLPTNMLFGAIGLGEYRDRLATPAGRPTCEPQPTTRARRDLI